MTFAYMGDGAQVSSPVFFYVFTQLSEVILNHRV